MNFIDTRYPVVWLITDQKPGHRNQLRGLGDRLAARADAQIHWIEAKKHPVSWLQALLGLAPKLPYPTPDILVAAGSQTQKLLLACRNRYSALSVVLMRPVLPFARPDLSIIPAHDNPPDRPDVLVTRGVLNAITPQLKTVNGRNGLVLLGGPSEHYEWDSEEILQQLETLAGEYPDWHWKITSSRRTPADLLERLSGLTLENITFYHHDKTAPTWLLDTLADTRTTWVSPDSVSMVYEALTAGTPTGLLHLKARHDSRVVRGMEALKVDGLVTEWRDRAQLMRAENSSAPQLWEADRASEWLIKKFRESR
ncbi:ELM1/GtrOC1 family putative glycosyltransferase [Marinobacter sp.]|uniref:mitochondrial fission ELM1 family protein n=1 Tax=Marinobacter sp. TaxID=50741 RepID=UPI0019B219CC|nr:ELM1/GtrOC1 family putative glycosyltransferase [Marinobacter sp.]MBC7192123.1 mitochondrial fission ELM1 family protein [Marinobacter sp.]